jgi:putative multiple sugar transport system substrate-binding protein
MIIDGKQSMTVFKDARLQDEKAIEVIDNLINGKKVEVNDTESYHNGVLTVPSYLCTPLTIDSGNYKAVLVDTGYFTEEELK